MDLLKTTSIPLTLKNTLGVCALGFFAIQPWDRYLSDAIWLLLALISLTYVLTKKYQGHDFNTPKNLQRLFWVFTLFPMISIISYAFSPLDTLTPKALEPETRWLLLIPIIITMREQKIGPNWILVFLAAYAINTFLTAGQETHWFKHINIRANGDENAVPYGMFNATIGLMLLAYVISPYIKQANLKANKIISIRLVISVLIACSFIAAFLSGTRAAILLIPMVVIILYVSHYSFKKAAISIIILSGLGIIFMTSQPNNATINRLATVKDNTLAFFIKADYASKITSTGARLEQWRESSCIFRKHPLLGTGPRSYRYAHQVYGGKKQCNGIQQAMYTAKGGSYQAHSLYFNTLGTLGLAGMSTLALLFSLLFKTAITAFKSQNRINKLGGGLLITVLASHAINGITLDLLFMNHVIDKNLIVIALPLLLIFHKHTAKPIDQPLINQ